MLKKILTVLGFLFFSLSALADESVNLGIDLTLPSAGQRNWNELFITGFAEPISAHQHTGSGDGLQIPAEGIAAGAITGDKIRLENDEYLVSENHNNSGLVGAIKVTSANTVAFGVPVNSIDLVNPLAVTEGGTEATTAAGARTNLGLSTMATQSANGVAITGGDIGGVVFNSDILTSDSSFILSSNTSDGSDTKNTQFWAGGAASSGRGAGISLHGNEASSTGWAEINAGNVSGAQILLRTFGAQPISFFTDALSRWLVATDGDLENNDSNGGDLIFNKAGTGVVDKLASVSAGGTTQGGATAITSRLSYITSASANNGVILPADKVGASYKLFIPTNGVKLYPPVDGSINFFTIDTPKALAANSIVECTSYGSGLVGGGVDELWVCTEEVGGL